MKHHTLTLLGGTPGELAVPAETLLAALGALLEGARQAARFFVEGESTRKGPRPAWVEEVSRVEVTGLTGGSAVIGLQVPTLAEAAPDRFAPGRQISLFPEPQHVIDPGETAVDLFARVLSAAIAGNREAVLADRALLDTCVRLVNSTRDGYAGVQLGELSGRPAPLVIGRDDLHQLELLRDETPRPAAVRVSGTLDTISATRPDILLKLSEGQSVPARLEAHDLSTLRQLVGSRVVVSGVAQFRPSGRLLVIDAEYIGPARETDALFESAPTASRPGAVAPLIPQDESSGVAAFFGAWPGDETETELLRALESVR